jgi:fructoselysine-6-P-deglycase FrlB-like protein
VSSEWNKANGAQEAARVMNAAAEQIGLAMKDSQPAVDALGTSLARLADYLVNLQAGRSDDARLKNITTEMARAVTGLQFYDRMTQHLSHVRDYLASSAAELRIEEGVPGEPWDSLHRKLAKKLLSETHRMYLGKNFPADYLEHRGGQSREERGAAHPGDIDLF